MRIPRLHHGHGLLFALHRLRTGKRRFHCQNRICIRCRLRSGVDQSFQRLYSEKTGKFYYMRLLGINGQFNLHAGQPGRHFEATGAENIRKNWIN